MKIKNFIKNKVGQGNIINPKKHTDIIETIDKLAKLINSNEQNRIKIFEIAEKHGIHITPVHFYQAIPDTRTISRKIFDTPQHHKEIDFREEAQLQLLKELSTYSDELDNIPENKPPGKIEYYFNNGMFGPMDAFVYYCMIRKFSPTKIIEVGSGFSTLIASKAATRNNGGQIISIEPYPREFLKKGLPYMTELIPTPVQKVPLENFKILKKDDILFIDSSHVSKINSDVNYLYLHVIPELNPGVIIHIHDFFLPFEYPREWIMKQKRFWNELYLVWAFLIGNSKYEILMANHFLTRLHRTEVDTSFSTISKFGGGSGSLWLRKI